MILNLNNKEALWFGYKLNDKKNVSFSEGVYLLLSENGISQEVIQDKFNHKSPSSISPLGKNGRTEREWLDACRVYMESLGSEKWEDPDFVTIIGKVDGLPIKAEEILGTLEMLAYRD